MIFFIAILFILAALGISQAPAAPESAPGRHSSRAQLALRAATPDSAAVPCHGKFELTLDLDAAYDNPFDPGDARVYAVFTPPRGERVTVEGFYYRAFERRMNLFEHGKDVIEPAGEPVWKVRFAPTMPGEWRYIVFVRDRTGAVGLPEASFIATASAGPGFVRRSAANPAMFAFEGEAAFVPLGLNLGWAGWWPGARGYAQWFPALAGAGGNFARVWMCSWNFGLEWTPSLAGAEPGKWGERRVGDYEGLGAYSLDNAWRLDEMFELAERSGIYILLCLGTYGEFTEGGAFNEGQWRQNPYNAANNGPCSKPEEFWTDARARELYRRRLRYIAARYAHNTSFFGWEFWNEAHAPAPWTAEMARFLKGAGEFAGLPADPYRKPVSTTYGTDEVWRLPEIDFTMSHIYGEGNMADHAPAARQAALRQAEFGKPHLLAEFGIDWRSSDAKYDPGGAAVNLRNALWASIMSGDAGGAMIWYWDDYVHEKNLYKVFSPLRSFVASVPWTSGAWKPLRCDAPKTDSREALSDLVLPASTTWGKAPFSEFTITPAGEADGKPLPTHLYGNGEDKALFRTVPVFRVNYRRPGRFIIRVHTVCSRVNRIRFLLDGVTAKELALDPAPPENPAEKPEYKETALNPEWRVYQALFDKEYGIDVPAGEHIIALENIEGDWVSVSEIRLTGYGDAGSPAMRLYGLTNGEQAALWAQNAAHNWKNIAEKKPVPAIRGASTVIRGLPAGRYSIRWLDTRTGAELARAQADCADGALPASLPDIEADAAAIIVPEKPR